MKNLIHRLQEQNISLSVDKDELLIDFEGEALTSELIEEIRAQKTVLISYLKRYQNEDRKEPRAIEKTKKQRLYDLSPSQKRLWLLDKIDASSSSRNIKGIDFFTADLRLDLLEISLNKLIERHEILRTIFVEDKGIPQQKILTNLEIKIPLLSTQKSIADIEQEVYTHEFELQHWPLFKSALIRQNDGYVLIYSMHHIIADGWSKQIFTRDLGAIYESLLTQKEVQLPNLDIQYKDYAAWQNERLLSNKIAFQEEYWRSKLSRLPAYLQLPADHVVGRNQLSKPAGFYTVCLNGSLKEKIDQILKAQRASLFSFFISTFKILLNRLTSETDILTGIPVANRNHAQVKDLIGFFLNTLMLRTQLDTRDSFDAFLQKANETLLSGLENQEYPFESLLEKLDLVRDYSRFPLSPVFLNLLDFDKDESERLTDFLPKEGQLLSEAKFELECYFKSFENGFQINCVYNSHLFEPTTIKYWIEEYLKLIHQVVANPSIRIDGIKIFEQALLEEENPCPDIDFIPFDEQAINQSIVSRFESQVALYPDNIAIEQAEKKITYSQLNTRVDDLAVEIIAGLAGKKGHVALLLEHGEMGILGMLAVLKSGNVYVPLDPEYPLDRLKYMLQDSACKMLLASTATLPLAYDLQTKGGEILLLPILETSGSRVPSITEAISPESEAYILYTSGSTGRPKGVVQSHRNVLHFIRVYTNNLRINTNDKISLLPTYSFDAAVMDIYGALLNGATLCVYNIRQRGLDELLYWTKSNDITIFHTVPTIYRHFVDTLKEELIEKVRLLVLGGEAVNAADFEKFKRHFGQEAILINGYGPTESTITLQKFLNHSTKIRSRNIPIGKPVADTMVYLLNEEDQNVGIYQTGEIVYKSDYLALAYWNDAGQTQKVFTLDPLTNSGRVYRSGDLGRMLPNGEIEFVGRKDSQVKLMGQRVELAEIEGHLSCIAGVKEVAVLLKTFEKESCLVAYVRKDEAFEEGEAKKILSLQLPHFMIPKIFVYLDTFPLTPTGKISRMDLPEPLGKDLPAISYHAPGNEIESKIVQIWEAVLQQKGIGVKDDFFALGGQSLAIIKLINEYHQTFEVRLEAQKLFFNPILESHADLIGASSKLLYQAIGKTSEASDYPLSHGQYRLYLLSQMETHHSAYNMPFTVVLNGIYNLTNFKKAINALIVRHEILRTVFRLNDRGGEIRQRVLSAEALDFDIDYVDLRPFTNKEQRLRTFLENDSYQPFDLEKGPLLRATLFHLEESRYVFYYNMHHIISDGWSMNILSRDVLAYYHSYQLNQEVALPDLKIQYKDFVFWQLAQLSDTSYKAHRTYWLEKLSGDLPLLDLPTSKSRPVIVSNRGLGLSTYIDSGSTHRLRSFIKAQGGTLFMGLLALWKLLFYHYTAQSDIILGTPIAGRDHVDLKDQIGFYVNTLVLRTKVSTADSFIGFYNKIKTATLQDYEHQMYPFDKLVEDLQVKRDPSRNAVFDVLLTLQNTGDKIDEQEVTEDDCDEIISLGINVPKFDVEIVFKEIGDCLRCNILYNSDVYERPVMENLLQHFKQLLKAVLDRPEENICQINYLTNAEELEILNVFNDTTVAYPKNKTVVDLLKDQVQKTPDKIAVVFEAHSYTYKEIATRSNQLAHHLITEHQIKVGDLVAIKLERSERMVISILAVLKSGAAYVPIDPQYPENRIRFIETDSDCKATIDEVFLQLFDASQYSAECPQVSIQADTLAYVIYTSGTTGNPKGVKNGHAGLLNRLLWTQDYFNLDPEKDVVLQKTTFCFDVSVWEFLWPLITGVKLVLATPKGHKDSDYLRSIIVEEGITTLHFVPSMLTAFLMDSKGWNPANLQRVLCSGEALQLYQIQQFQSCFGNAISLYNLYGPTEAAIDVTCWEVPLNEIGQLSVVPIGRPVANTSIYILNEADHLCAKGITGELVIGGVQVAQGYLGRETLSKEKFVTNPFPPYVGSRMYRTGDLARWLPDGNIEYLGRKDGQVKIRGYRIELSEIEQILLQQKIFVKQAVVAVKQRKEDSLLVAYIVAASKEWDKECLRDALKKELPEYMIPAYFVLLEALPLSPNGKINRKALPEVEEKDLIKKQYVAPRNETEYQLAEIWQTILGLQKIGIADNFFDLGGHSLLVMRMLTNIRSLLGKSITVREVFLFPVLADLAKHLTGVTSCAQENILPQKRPANIPLSFAQERLWFIDKLEGSIHYHIPAVLKIDGAIEVQALEKSLKTILDRHEILRTVIREEAGKAFQVIQTSDAFSVELEEANLTEEALQEKVKLAISKPFDLANDYLIRVKVMTLSDSEQVLVIVMHHLTSDGWSLPIIVGELRELYKAYTEGIPAKLKPLEVQYADYSIWQRNYLQGKRYEAKLKYWEEHLRDLVVLDLPLDYTRPLIQSTKGARYSFRIEKELTNQIRSLSKVSGSTLFMTLLAIYKILLHRYTGQTDICVGTTVANRGQKEIENLIGFFVNTLALRTFLESSDSFEEVLAKVKELALKAYDHQDLPFEKIVDKIIKERDRSRPPVFQTLFTLQNNEAIPNLELGANHLSVLPYDPTTAKYELSLTAYELEESLFFTIDYCSDLFSSARIERLAIHFKNLVTALVNQPDQEIGLLEMISSSEKQQLLFDFNPPLQNGVKYNSIKHWFEQQVENNPDATALVFGAATFSYRQLDEKSNQLAHFLLASGMKIEQLVPICINRSMEMIIAILGIIKAGGAYVPIDPDLPLKRIDFILKDIDATIVLTHSGLADLFSELKINALFLDQFAYETYADVPLNISLLPHHLIYVIYTSGTSGQPKGVMVEHHSVMNLIAAQTTAFGIQNSERILQFSNYAFDASVEQIFLALLNGAALILLEDIANAIPTILQTQQISHLHATPGFLTALGDLSAQKSLKRIIAGGEVCSIALAQNVGQNFKFYNEYGPTETTVTSIEYQYLSDQQYGSVLPIGRPIRNTQIYLLSDKLTLQPVGVVGELFIAGSGLARGYLKRPELTAEKFVDNPFVKGQRMYRTGDLARWLPDGNLEFIGRKDTQVKIRAYRIELKEIEYHLKQIEGIKQVLVLAREEAKAAKHLVAYLVKEQDVNEKSIVAYLKQNLPDYMIPGVYITLDSIPLTLNGKIDYKALPGADFKASAEEYTEPRNALEKQLVTQWQELLGLDRVGIQDNFFEIGGDSILSIQMLSRLKASGYDLELSDLFVFQTIADLSGKIGGTYFPSENRTKISDQKVAVFCIPGLGGSPIALYKLGSLLNKHFSVHYLEDPGLEDPTMVLSSVEEIARFFIRRIEEESNAESCILLGYSFGGSVAYEIARQMERENKKIKHLVILDAQAPHKNTFNLFDTHSPYAEKIYKSVEALLQVNDVNLDLDFEEFEHKSESEIFELLARKTEDNDSVDLLRFVKIYVRQAEASINYKVDLDAALNIPTMLLKTRKNLEAMKHYAAAVAVYQLEDYGWGELVTPKVASREVEGYHQSILKEPYVEGLAAIILSELNKNTDV